ncbi:hypothetical protein ACFX10_039702 [Malus domestica]
MEGRFAHELYSESLSLSKIKLDGEPSANSIESDRQDHDRVESCDEDGSWYASDDELHEQSALGLEWQRRHNQYHTTGYRDGVIAGKEASSQEGFNIGFKKSVLVGYNWGLVRGVTSALACLPDGLKEKLIETEEQRNGFQRLFESVHSMSTKDALGTQAWSCRRTTLELSLHEAVSFLSRNSERSRETVSCVMLEL